MPWIDDTKKVHHADITEFCPLLNGKMLNLDIAYVKCGLGLVDHCKSSVVVNVQ